MFDHSLVGVAAVVDFVVVVVVVCVSDVSDVVDVVDDVSVLLSRVLAGVARPLKLRIISLFQTLSNTITTTTTAADDDAVDDKGECVCGM